MQNAKKGKATQKATVKPATVKAATLQHTGNEITYACIWAFVNTHAAGQPQNVAVVPLPNVKAGTASPVPFGYTGKTYFICSYDDKQLNKYKELHKDKVVVFSKKDYKNKFDIGHNFDHQRVVVYARNA